MERLRTMLVSACFIALSCSSLEARTIDSNLEQNRMITTAQGTIVHTPTSDKDYLTAYDHNGWRLWNIAFPTKIISWQINPHNGYLFVFSEVRYSDSTKLTCFDPIEGSIVWEKP